MPEEEVLAEAGIERIGSRGQAVFRYRPGKREKGLVLKGQSIPDYVTGIKLFLDKLLDPEEGVLERLEQIERIGFKTVLAKGYYGVHIITEDVIRGMEDMLAVAPAHNKPYLDAIRQFKGILPHVVMVGAFETDFHRTIPLERTIYAVPYEWYEKYGLRRMGYHGASHSHVAVTMSALEGDTGRLISCHLGGSCSLCALLDGRSVDTSFGFSLQTGIVHANRAGDVDAYVFPYLLDKGLSLDEILDGLSKKGGLLGLSGISNDLREIIAAMPTNERARLAVDHFCNGIIKYIGAFYAELGGLDRLVFTGGIGENSALIRKMVCRQLPHLGILLDEERNEDPGDILISAANSRVKVYVIPAAEEIGIARQTYALC